MAPCQDGHYDPRSSMSGDRVAQHGEETGVTPLELFFDLVFVFAVTQVTTLLAEDTSALGAFRGLLVLAAVWWAWVAYAWLTNHASVERPGVRLSLLVSMGAMLVVSLSVPHAFGSAALLFALALFAVRLSHLVLYAVTAHTAALRRAVFRLAPGVVVGGSLLIIAAFTRGTTQLALWILALALDYAAPILSRTDGWHVHPSHFAERHGLIVIIALGEAIISLGVGAAGHPISTPLVVGAVAGLVCAACIWWLYFDVVIVAAERKLAELDGAERNRLARNSYSYLHLPIIAGIVLFALGAKMTLAHFDEPLHDFPAVALGLGPALVLATLSVLRRRHQGRHNRFRLAAALLCAGCVALALFLTSIVALCALAAIFLVLVVGETIWVRRMRRAGGA